jgi:hypothetical protein
MGESTKLCLFKDCESKTNRSPFCRIHLRIFVKDFKEFRKKYGLDRDNFSYDFLSKKRMDPKEYMRATERITESGFMCVVGGCMESGSHKELCPKHNTEIVKYVRELYRTTP